MSWPSFVPQPLAADNMSRGFSHAYDLALGFELRRAWTLHRALFGGPTDVRWDLAAAARGRTIQHYDEALTTHIFGCVCRDFASACRVCGWHLEWSAA